MYEEQTHFGLHGKMMDHATNSVKYLKYRKYRTVKNVFFCKPKFQLPWATFLKPGLQQLKISYPLGVCSSITVGLTVKTDLGYNCTSR